MSSHEDIGAYLLNALDEHERAAFEQHLAGCADCREEIERLRVAADALGASPVQLAPPPELKHRIMAVVNSEAELLRAAGPRADSPRPRRRRSWSLRPSLALAGAAAILILGALAGMLGAGTLGGGNVRTIAAQVSAAGARASVIDRDGEHSTLVAQHLPDPGPGRVYQVWLQSGSGPARATNALFDVRRDGSASVDIPAALDDVDQVMVTSEPHGGSAAPTTDPIIVADVT